MSVQKITRKIKLAVKVTHDKEIDKEFYEMFTTKRLFEETP